MPIFKLLKITGLKTIQPWNFSMVSMYRHIKRDGLTGGWTNLSWKSCPDYLGTVLSPALSPMASPLLDLMKRKPLAKTLKSHWKPGLWWGASRRTDILPYHQSLKPYFRRKSEKDETFKFMGGQGRSAENPSIHFKACGAFLTALRRASSYSS